MKLIFFISIAVAAGIVQGLRPDIYDTSGLRWSPARRSVCTGAGDKCFTTQECCGGYVCAAFNDYYGLNPEVPGNCVKEKHLRTCFTSQDCEDNFKCVSLSADDPEHFCVPRPPGEKEVKVKQGGAELGAFCDDDSDCNEFTSDGSKRLCCQYERIPRLPSRYVCKIAYPKISVCTPPGTKKVSKG